MSRDEERRGKKTFAERDKELRTHKSRRDDTHGAQGPKQRAHEYRAYKSQLEKIFDGGGLPDALKQKLEGTATGQAAKAKREALTSLKEAAGQELVTQVAAYTERYGAVEDEEVLAKILELDDEPGLIVTALQTIERLVEEGRLKKSGSLKMRVKAVQMTTDDDDAARISQALLGKL